MMDPCVDTFCRPEVKGMALAMEIKLRADDGKGGWKDEFPQWLINRAQDELAELDEVVDEIRANGPTLARSSAVWAEAADVANFAMMAADVATSGCPTGRAGARIFVGLMLAELEGQIMANDDLVERVSIIAGCGFPEHTRSFANENAAGDFAAGLQENYLTVIAWRDGTITEIACLAVGGTVVMTVMDPKQMEGIYPGLSREEELWK